MNTGGPSDNGSNSEPDAGAGGVRTGTESDASVPSVPSVVADAATVSDAGYQEGGAKSEAGVEDGGIPPLPLPPDAATRGDSGESDGGALDAPLVDTFIDSADGAVAN
jgi:hypothetical protein